MSQRYLIPPANSAAEEPTSPEIEKFKVEKNYHRRNSL